MTTLEPKIWSMKVLLNVFLLFQLFLSVVIIQNFVLFLFTT